METILGPFHPYLENALVEEIRRHKKADPFCPLLLLVPSGSLRRRLKVLLVGEHRLNLLNLQILTFHQFSLRLIEEQRGGDNLELRDDSFLEEVLRQIIRTGRQVPSVFSGIDERVGGCAALWQTLRDLKDGMVEPSLALEALREGHFGRDLSDRISNLLVVFRTVLSFCKEWDIHDYSDLDRLASEQVSSSQFLKQFGRIFYYGFYDLTQVQTDLFHAVAQSYPTTLLFPLLHAAPSHPGWVFAERFYQRYVQGISGTKSQTRNLIEELKPGEGSHVAFRLFDEERETRHGPLPKDWRCKILSSFGADDEIAAVAKEILRLVSDERMAFEEIGVVARGLESYVSRIKEIFRAHQIPATGSAEEPLVQFPLAKAVTLFINLRSRDYLRSHLIDLVSSPYFNSDPLCAEAIHPRPDLWDLLTRRIGISKGIEEWRRLQRYSSRDLIVSEVWDEDHPRVARIAAAQIRALWSLIEGLHRDLSALPKEASWTRYVGAWKELLEKYLGISTGNPKPRSPEERCSDAIVDILDKLAGLDAVDAKISLNYFTQTYQRWLERSAVPLGDENIKGVAVMNAMAARGLSFRALFIVGLNEGVFPRTIREDAFLRDREREIFERDLGYKVSQKLAGFDEEKLIFTLLVGAARERLYCLYQRSDETGRVLAPSWYLDELRRALRESAAAQLQEITIPRGIADKAEKEPFNRSDLLLPEELAVQLSLEGKDPTCLIDTCSLSADFYKQGRQVVERLDLSSARLDGFDGVVGPLSYWSRFSKNGISPTALETYARCPFQFFAGRVLGLERLERPEEITGPSVAEFGELGHLILKSFYQELIDRDYFAGQVLDLQTILKAVAQRSFADYESKNPVGYPLAWESLQESLIELLSQVVTLDLEELSRSGYRPIALETDLTEQLQEDWPEPLQGLTIYGRMDRIDRQPAENGLRVIDYKFKFGGSSSASDRDLYRSALRGEKLQPPFYLLLGNRLAAQKEIKLTGGTTEAVFYYLAPRWSEGPLVKHAFDADGLRGNLGEKIKGTLAYLAKGIQEGRFFIQPGDYCRHCEVSEICRKNHPPSLWRAENDPITKAHRELREKSLK